MTSCNNCWTGQDCLDCPYRIRTHVEPKINVEKALNDVYKVFVILTIILIILA